MHVTNEILQKLRVEGFRKIYLKKINDVTALAVAPSFAGLVLAHGKHLYRSVGVAWVLHLCIVCVTGSYRGY